MRVARIPSVFLLAAWSAVPQAVPAQTASASGPGMTVSNVLDRYLTSVGGEALSQVRTPGLADTYNSLGAVLQQKRTA